MKDIRGEKNGDLLSRNLRSAVVDLGRIVLACVRVNPGPTSLRSVYEEPKTRDNQLTRF